MNNFFHTFQILLLAPGDGRLARFWSICVQAPLACCLAIDLTLKIGLILNLRDVCPIDSRCLVLFDIAWVQNLLVVLWLLLLVVACCLKHVWFYDFAILGCSLLTFFVLVCRRICGYICCQIEVLEVPRTPWRGRWRRSRPQWTTIRVLFGLTIPLIRLLEIELRILNPIILIRLLRQTEILHIDNVVIIIDIKIAYNDLLLILLLLCADQILCDSLYFCIQITIIMFIQVSAVFIVYSMVWMGQAWFRWILLGDLEVIIHWLYVMRRDLAVKIHAF